MQVDALVQKPRYGFSAADVAKAYADARAAGFAPAAMALAHVLAAARGGGA